MTYYVNKNILDIINILPNSLKENTDICFDECVRIRKDGRIGTRVTIGRLLTNEEKKEMKKNKRFVQINHVEHYPGRCEYDRSFFYVVKKEA